MAKYTIDIYTLLKDEDFKLFNFNYNFYSDDEQLKLNFEEKFINTFMFNEIGFETVARFKHYLSVKLNNIMPYYKQLYETELRCIDIDFMLNKDLKETFVREVEGNVNNNSSSNATNTNDFKESSLDNGNATLNTEHSLTSISNSKDNGSVDSSSNTNNSERETTTLLSQGNIGVTSSAELLEKWRRVLINIDNMILDECKDLFMMIY